MASGDEYVNIQLKRFLSQNRMSDEFLTYLRTLEYDNMSRIFPAQGLFTFPAALAHNGALGTFTIGTDPVTGTDSEGHVVGLTGATYLNNIPYENTLNDIYWLAMHYIEIPSGVYNNPRTGVPEYDKYQEFVGELGIPNTVVDNGDGTITLRVNSVLQTAIDHSGRPVMVWLVNPVSADATVAIETITTAYAAPNNTIHTLGGLGQGTISVVAADYRVALLGISVNDAGPAGPNPYAADYIILGNVTGSGGGAGAHSTSDQVDLSGGGGHTLQHAYDGVGAGAGRTITSDDQAVQLRQGPAAFDREDDIGNAALRIRKDLTTALYGAGYEDENAIDITSRMGAFSNNLVRVPVADLTGGTDLYVEELIDVLAPGATITATRVAPGIGVDFTFAVSGANAQIIPGLDLVELSNTITGNAGLYLVNNVSGVKTLVLDELDGNPAALVADNNVTCRVYRPLVNVGPGPQNLILTGVNELHEDQAGAPMGGAFPNLRINVPENTDANDVIYDQERLVTGGRIRTYADGRIVTTNNVTIPAAFAYGFASTVTRWIQVPPSEFLSQGLLNATIYERKWDYVPLPALNSYGWSMNAGTVLPALIFVPIKLPNNSTWTGWEVLIDDANLAGNITAEGFALPMNWGALGVQDAGAQLAPVSLEAAGPVASVGVATPSTLVDTFPAGRVHNIDESYQIIIAGVTNGNGIVYGARYQIQTVVLDY